MARRRLQRIPLHLLQVPDRRTDRLRRRLVRRDPRRLRVGHAGRLGDSAPLSPSQGRPIEIWCGRGQHADLQSARMAVAAGRRPLPDLTGASAAEFPGMSETYDDGLIQLDRAAITLRRYHFPSGTSKVIALDTVRGYKAEALGLFVQRFRVWGRSDFRRWLPLDVQRPLKSTLITLDVPGTWPSPAFTPARPDEFTALLDELLSQLG